MANRIYSIFSSKAEVEGDSEDDNGVSSTTTIDQSPLLPTVQVRDTTQLRSFSRKDGVSFSRSWFNATNALSGIGVLSMPYAVSEGGWLSLIFFFFIAIIFCYTGILIKRCMDADPSINNYVDIAEAAFGYKGKIAIAAIIYFELYIAGVGQLVLEGDNLQNLFPIITSIEVFSLSIKGKQLFIIVATLIILPTTWLRSLGVLAYFSAIGIFASFILLSTLLWTGITDTGFHAPGRVFNLSGLPMALGLYAICFCGHAIFPNIYTSMKETNRFSKVLFIAFSVGAVNCGLVAVLGYLMYGGDTQSQVTLNLPAGKAYSKLAIYTTIITPFTKYAWSIIPIAMTIEERCSPDGKGSPNIVVRSLLVLGTMLIALVIPFFEYIMAFMGSFLGVTVSLLLPCMCYLKIFKDSRKCVSELVKIISILIFGTVIAIFGTYSSVSGIISNM